MKKLFDCRLYTTNGDGSFDNRIGVYTAENFNKAFKIGAYFYNAAERGEFPNFAGFIITYEGEVDELATIAFHKDKDNFYYNTAKVGKLIKKYLPVASNQITIF